MLLARPLCHIFEPNVARESKSLPTPGLDAASCGTVCKITASSETFQFHNSILLSGTALDDLRTRIWPLFANFSGLKDSKRYTKEFSVKAAMEKQQTCILKITKDMNSTILLNQNKWKKLRKYFNKNTLLALVGQFNKTGRKSRNSNILRETGWTFVNK